MPDRPRSSNLRLIYCVYVQCVQEIVTESQKDAVIQFIIEDGYYLIAYCFFLGFAISVILAHNKRGSRISLFKAYSYFESSKF
jgi:hypothetical protein